MPNLLNRSKHEEFEWNSALQIKNQKERRVEKDGKWSSFAEGCENSHRAKMLLHFLVIFFCSVDLPFDFLFVIFPIFPFMYYGY